LGANARYDEPLGGNDEREMPGLIEDFALIGDTQTAALVSRDGSIDWLCVPRFDSRACFAALVGSEDNGRWLLAPEGDMTARGRQYRRDTLVLDTQYDPDEMHGVVADRHEVGDDDRALLRLVLRVEHQRVPPVLAAARRHVSLGR